jgi:hypothetical protein
MYQFQYSVTFQNLDTHHTNRKCSHQLHTRQRTTNESRRRVRNIRVKQTRVGIALTIVTKLRAGRQRNRGIGRKRRFFSFLQRPERLWRPTSLKRAPRAYSLEVKWSGCTDDHSFPSSAKNTCTCSYTANSQDVFTAWCSIRQATEKLYLYMYFKSHPEVLDMWLTQSHFWILLCDYNVGEH